MSNKQKNKVPDEYEKHVAESGGELTVAKFGKYENLIARILCVFAAVALWFYVVSADTTAKEKNFSGIPVKIRGIETVSSEQGLTVISGYGCTVDLTLAGPKTDIDRLAADDIDVYVDGSSITGAGEYTLEIIPSLPNGVSVVSQSVNYVSLYLDKSMTVTVPVKVNPVFTIESTYTLGTPEPSLETVNVTGPAEELEKLSHAAVSLDLGRVTKTLTASGTLTLVDQNGGTVSNPFVKLQNTEITVRFPVYTYKDIPLTVEYKYGYYNDSNVTVSIKPASIRIKGEPDALEDYDHLLVLQLDEKKITGDTSLSAKIVLPDDVTNVSGIETANVQVTHKNTETREIVVTNLSVLNPNGLNYKLESGSLNVKFRGARSLLSLLSSNNITATLDLGYLNKASGTVSVPVTVQVTSALEGSVYEIGAYKLDVTIS